MQNSNPKVILGGTEYSVPPLVPRQMRIVLPACIKVTSLLKVDINGWSQDTIDALYQVVWWGAIEPNGAKPTYAEFLNLNVSFQEMLVAFPIIQQQTGMFTLKEDKKVLMGEAQANPDSQTGI
jgi:hypothetical protein